MADQNWGHCQHCRYFGSPARIPLPNEEARCTQPELARFELKVFGASGCKAFELRPGLGREVEEPREAQRLAYYKGVDRAIRAVARARALGRENVRLTIMGAGEEEGALRALVAELGLGDRVVFRPPVRYGEEMFARIRPHHLMLGTPLTTDTPRSTWDAIASAVPVLAFDTEFYRDLASATGLVETVPWPSADALGDRIAHYAEHREELVPRMRRAPAIARENTSEAWLAKRARWTLELLPEVDREVRRPPAPARAA